MRYTFMGMQHDALAGGRENGEHQLEKRIELIHRWAGVMCCPSCCLEDRQWYVSLGFHGGARTTAEEEQCKEIFGLVFRLVVVREAISKKRLGSGHQNL